MFYYKQEDMLIESTQQNDAWGTEITEQEYRDLLVAAQEETEAAVRALKEE